MVSTLVSMESAAGRLVEAAVPSLSTPKMCERVAVFESAQDELARHCKAVDFRDNQESDFNPRLIIPIGIYATRAALYSFLTTEDVTYGTICQTAGEVQTFCDSLRRYAYKHSSNGEFVGLAAELGIANVLWSGIEDGELALKYAFLMGVSGREKEHIGLKKDVDLVVGNISGKNRERHKLQVKASVKKSRNVYAPGVTVITAQGLLGTPTPIEAVAKLLKWDRTRKEDRGKTYHKLRSILAVIK